MVQLLRAFSHFAPCTLPYKAFILAEATLGTLVDSVYSVRFSGGNHLTLALTLTLTLTLTRWPSGIAHPISPPPLHPIDTIDSAALRELPTCILVAP